MRTKKERKERKERTVIKNTRRGTRKGVRRTKPISHRSRRSRRVRKGGIQIGGFIITMQFPVDDRMIDMRPRECDIQEMGDVSYNSHGYEPMSLTDAIQHKIRGLGSTFTRESVDSILNDQYFIDKFGGFVEGAFEVVVLHSLRRTSAGYFPKLHSDYNMEIGIGDGCVEMCRGLFSDGDAALLPDMEYIHGKLSDVPDSRLFPLNIWCLLECEGDTLQNDNLGFFSKSNTILGVSNTFVIQGVSYVSYGNGEKLFLHTSPDVTPDCSGYFFNPTIPHCSIRKEDRPDSGRGSIEFRLILIRAEDPLDAPPIG
jgi:hypothetical protein